jgi:hypothetical protein
MDQKVGYISVKDEWRYSVQRFRDALVQGAAYETSADDRRMTIAI